MNQFHLLWCKWKWQQGQWRGKSKTIPSLHLFCSVYFAGLPQDTRDRNSCRPECWSDTRDRCWPDCQWGTRPDGRLGTSGRCRPDCRLGTRCKKWPHRWLKMRGINHITFPHGRVRLTPVPGFRSTVWPTPVPFPGFQSRLGKKEEFNLSYFHSLKC